MQAWRGQQGRGSPPSLEAEGSQRQGVSGQYVKIGASPSEFPNGGKLRVALVDLESERSGWNKDQAGSFGTRIGTGASIFSKLLDRFKRTGIRLPVLYLAYANAILRREGHEVTHHLNDFPKDAQLVLIPSSIVDCKWELDFARRVKKESNATVGALGAFSSVKPEYYLHCFDFVVVGEPEDALIRIARKEQELSELRGIVKSEPIKDLDSLPFPDWTGFPVEEYRYFPTLTERPFITMVSSRGCPYDCTYCPYIVLQGSTFRKRSAVNVVQEIAQNISNYGIKGLLFRDPLFTLDKQRVSEICKEIVRRGVSIKWCCETRVDCLDESLIDEMRNSGMRAINLGVESANPEILRSASRKPATLEYQERIVNYLEDSGVKVVAFYILGFPGDTKETIDATIEYAKKLNTSIAQFTILTPYPGTKYYDQVRDQITTSDWTCFNGYTPVVKTENLDVEQLLAAKQQAFSRYYLRRSWILRKSWKAIS